MLYKLTTSDYKSITAHGKYCKQYIPGCVTSADPNTLGLMVFETYKNVKSFYKFIHYAVKPVKVLAVRGIGLKTIPKKVCNGSSEAYLDYFYSHIGYLTSYMVMNIPLGTVCFPKVEVLYQKGPSLGI